MKQLTGPTIGDLQTADNLIIFLHGYGANGDDLIEIGKYWQNLLPNTAFFAPNAPEPCPFMTNGYQWFALPDIDYSTLLNGAKKAYPLLKLTIEHIWHSTNIRPEKTFLFGFSQGTMLSLYTAPRLQQSVAGVLGFSGLIVGHEDIAENATAKPPCFLSHGRLDDVVPFPALNMTEQHLRANGFPVETYISDQMGHGIDPTALKLGLNFIQKQLAVAA